MVSIRTQMSCGAETSSLALWENRTERSFSVIRCVGNMSQCEAFSFKVKPIDVETLSSLHCLSYLDTEGIITLFVFMCCCTVWKSSLLMVTFRTLKMHFRSSTVCSGAQSAAQCDECWRAWHWHRHTYCCQLSSAVNRICCVHRQRALCDRSTVASWDVVNAGVCCEQGWLTLISCALYTVHLCCTFHCDFIPTSLFPALKRGRRKRKRPRTAVCQAHIPEGWINERRSGAGFPLSRTLPTETLLHY